MALRSLRKTLMGCKMYVPNGQRKDYNGKFAKANALRTGRSGPYSQVLAGTNSEVFWW